jgi:hypothetical protein
MVGGGVGAFIGHVHRRAIALEGAAMPADRAAENDWIVAEYGTGNQDFARCTAARERPRGFLRT